MVEYTDISPLILVWFMIQFAFVLSLGLSSYKKVGLRSEQAYDISGGREMVMKTFFYIFLTGN